MTSFIRMASWIKNDMPYNFRYASTYVNAYGAEGYHNYMRNQDPSYDAFYADGPSVDDKWRSTYPYVPTSYLYQTQG